MVQDHQRSDDALSIAEFDTIDPGGDRSLALLIGIGVITAIILAGLYGIVVRQGPQVLGVQSALANEGQASSPALAAPAEPAPVLSEEVWRTPSRALFLLADEVDPVHAALVEQQLIASGLRVVERTQLERLLVEHDLVRTRQIDPDTAIALGRLVGGHIAVFVDQLQQELRLRSVLVETGEIAAAHTIPPSELVTGVAELLQRTLRILPARGYLISNDATSGAWIDLGRAQAVAPGDRFVVLQGTPQQPGDTIATAEVVEVTAGRSRVVLDGRASMLPALVRKFTVDP